MLTADTRCHPIACVGSRGLGQQGGVPVLLLILNYKHRHMDSQGEHNIGTGGRIKKGKVDISIFLSFDFYLSPEVELDPQRKFIIFNYKPNS